MFRIRRAFQKRSRGSVGGLEPLFTRQLHDLASSVVLGEAPSLPVGRKQDLSEHLEMVRREFIGRTEIEFAHAAMNVLLRRGVAEERSWKRFQQMWQECETLLLQRLSTRWLVSACDTIADYSSDRAERALALAGSLLVNTVKLYETEIWMKTTEAEEYQRFPESGITLFDGVTPFMVGGGDMVANLNARLKSICDKPTTASSILNEIFRRLHMNNTVFRRFQMLHTVEPTKWEV